MSCKSLSTSQNRQDFYFSQFLQFLQFFNEKAMNIPDFFELIALFALLH